MPASTIGTVLGDKKPKEKYVLDDGAGHLPNGEPRPVAEFESYRGKKRKRGTGYVKQLSKGCWQGRYTPTIDGKRTPMNIYVPTEKECEAKLAELIRTEKERRA